MSASALARAIEPLTAADRCDRCGVQAYVRATLKSGRELTLCGHHHRDYALPLLLEGARIHDELNLLTPLAA